MVDYDLLKRITIYISLGKQASMGLSDKNELVLTQHESSKNLQVINLGPFTKKRCEELKSYLDRLAIHVE